MSIGPIRARVKAFVRASVEHEQAVIRCVMVFITAVYLWSVAHPEPLFPLSPRLIVSVYLALSVALILRMVQRPEPEPLRKIVFTILDQVAIAGGVYPAGPTVPVLALAFWVMVGSGFRFGKAYLYLSAGVAVAGLLFNTTMSPHWAAHQIYGWAFALSIVTVAFYTTVLISRVTETNSRLTESLDRVSALARNDSLTGLPNRRALVERLALSIALAQRTGAPLSLLYIDIDGFKAVNDTLGHNAGDALLQQVTQRLKAQIRDTDMLARLGGDEFVVVLEGGGLPAGAPRVAQMILNTVREISLHGASAAAGAAVPLRVGASIGIASYDPAAALVPPTVEALIKEADEAMYAAKKGGKGCYRFSAEQAVAGPAVDDIGRV